MAKLNYIHPNQLKRHWEYVRKGVERISARCNDRWSIEDLYLLLKLEKAALYMIESDDIDAFVVLQLNDGFDGKEVNVFGRERKTTTVERAEYLLNNMKMPYVFSLSAFFLSNYQRLTKGTNDYLEFMMKKMTKKAQEATDLALSSIGDGIIL